MPRPHLVVWSWDAGYNSRLQPREWLAIIRYVISRNTSLPIGGKGRGQYFYNGLSGYVWEVICRFFMVTYP